MCLGIRDTKNMNSSSNYGISMGMIFFFLKFRTLSAALIKPLWKICYREGSSLCWKGLWWIIGNDENILVKPCNRIPYYHSLWKSLPKISNSNIFYQWSVNSFNKWVAIKVRNIFNNVKDVEDMHKKSLFLYIHQLATTARP